MTPETYMRRFHGPSLSAEEFLEGESCPLTQSETFVREDRRCRCGEDPSDCPREDDDCPFDRREVCCCCRPVRPEPPLDQEEEVENTCCCKESMVRALRLLCDQCLSSLVDFDSFFFLTDALAVGSPLTAPADQTDNIATLDASFRRFSPCNCDLLDVDATAYFDVPGLNTVALEQVEQLSLCALKAVAFGLNESECPQECEDRNFRRALRAFRREIRERGGTTRSCGTCGATCDCDDCCCERSILRELSSRNLSRLATLTVGPLVLQNVTVVGSLGSVLVLANEDQERFYFVCASQVEALG